MLLLPVGVVAQETPKIEVFGGYSYRQLTEQPRILLKSASLNGWNASVKLNLTPGSACLWIPEAITGNGV
jgi:hypothetical protein